MKVISMRRQNWTFSYSVREVLDAISLRLDYHLHRIAHYEQVMNDAKVDLQHNGINITEMMRELENTNLTRGYNQQPTIDQDKVRKFHEARERLKHHQDRFSDYGYWQRVLEHAPVGEMLSLDFDDTQFFGLSLGEE